MAPVTGPKFIDPASTAGHWQQGDSRHERMTGKIVGFRAPAAHRTCRRV